jgi:hypothetical protein
MILFTTTKLLRHSAPQTAAALFSFASIVSLPANLFAQLPQIPTLSQDVHAIQNPGTIVTNTVNSVQNTTAQAANALGFHLKTTDIIQDPLNFTRDLAVESTLKAVSIGRTFTATQASVTYDLGGQIAGDKGRKLADFVSSLDGLPNTTALSLLQVSAAIVDSGSVDLNGILSAPLAAALRSTYYDFLPRSHPLPQRIKTALQPFFDDSVIQEARYAVGDAHLDVAGVTIECQEIFTEKRYAVTAGNVMIFNYDPTETNDLTDIDWIAHELYHTSQYKTWGFESFAKRYLENNQAVEGEAYAMQYKVRAWISLHPPGSSTPVNTVNFSNGLYIVGSVKFNKYSQVFSVLSDDSIVIVNQTNYEKVGSRLRGPDPYTAFVINMPNYGISNPVQYNGDIVVFLGGASPAIKVGSFIMQQTALTVPSIFTR